MSFGPRRHTCRRSRPWSPKPIFPRQSKAWNDKKVTAHHAIIPTPNAAPADLSPADRAVYELIVRRYLAQFYPPFEYTQTRLELDIGGERFVASGRQVLVEGWKTVLETRAEGDPSDEGDGKPDDKDAASLLPPVRTGDRLEVLELAVTEKRTQPPKAFTDASLVHAMCNIAKFVSDPGRQEDLVRSRRDRNAGDARGDHRNAL